MAKGKRTKTVNIALGATRSYVAPSYHLIPAEGLRRVGERFGLGAVQHGERNWERALATRDAARAFAKEIYNHMFDHMTKLASNLDPKDDHVGAIGWAVMVLAQIEGYFGCKWTEL